MPPVFYCIPKKGPPGRSLSGSLLPEFLQLPVHPVGVGDGVGFGPFCLPFLRRLPGGLLDSERLRPTAETPETAVNAVTGAGEAPGITAAAKTSGSGSEEGGIRGELRDRYAPEKTTKGAGRFPSS